MPASLTSWRCRLKPGRWLLPLRLTARPVPGMLRAFHLARPEPAMLTLTALHLYPVKGIAGVDLDTAQLEPRGLRGDRRWLLVDADGRFLSQRELPSMSQLSAVADGSGWRLSAGPLQAALPPLRLLPPTTAARLAVTVWSDTVSARLASAEVNDWFSCALGQPVRAVYMDADAKRAVDRDYGRSSDEVSFADGFPLLIANAASLADLNRRIGEPLVMARFRPNLVIMGADPWAEDGWQRLRIGGVELDLVKPCARCLVTTLDPATGLPHPRQEPLRSMAGFRKQAGKLMFAVNAIPRQLGELSVGQAVEILA